MSISFQFLSSGTLLGVSGRMASDVDALSFPLAVFSFVYITSDLMELLYELFDSL